MLSIEMLPAERGDALLLGYGVGAEATNWVLVDGGPVNSGNYDGLRSGIEQVPVGIDGRRHFDLLVVSHIDSDHIEGVVKLLLDSDLRCVFDDIWFNGWRHIEPLNPGATVSRLGAAQGEFLGALLAKQGRPWNQYFGGGAIFVPDDGPLPSCVLRGGLELTLLSPDIAHLKKLAAKWDEELKKLDFEPGDAAAALAQLEHSWWARPPVTLGPEDPIRASDDRSAANGSSIAFIATYGNRSLLLAADAHDDVLTSSLRRLRSAAAGRDGTRVRVDAFKLSHHGSSKNTTRQLMEQLAADAYLISTNGDRFKHPDAIALETVVRHHGANRPKPVLCFNYPPNKQTRNWAGDDRVEALFERRSRIELETVAGPMEPTTA